MAMTFEYQIPEDEYVAAQLLFYSLKERTKRIAWGLVSVAGGVVLIVLACVGEPGWSSVVLGALGIWWLYAGFMSLFPGWYIRRQYPKSGMIGKRYRADVTAEGFEVIGDVQSWRVTWQGVIVMGEDDLVFMFGAANTVFTFGKQYLSEEQQRELRTLSGLAAH